MSKLNPATLAVLKRLKPYLMRHKGKAIKAALASAVAVVLQLPLPLLTMYLIDKLVESRNVPLVGYICGGLIVALLLRSLASWSERYFLSTFRVRVLCELKLKVYRHLLSLPLSYLQRRQTGYLVARATGDVEAIQGMFADTFLLVLRNILTFLVGLVMVFYLNTTLALIGLCLLPAFVFTMFGFNKKLRKLTNKNREYYANSVRYLQEHLSGLAVIKSFVSEGRDAIGMLRVLKQTVRYDFKASMWGNTVSLLANLVSSLGPILLLWVGIIEIIEGNLTIGGLIAFNSFLIYLFGPLQSLSSINVSIQNAVACAERVFEILDAPTEETVSAYLSKSNRFTIPHGVVSFERVTFRYPGMALPALEDVSFQMLPGQSTAIVGKSGAGKSSIAGLLLRFYDGYEGTISVDGQSIEDIDRYNLRSQIGYISQEPFLFGSSIADNLRLGDPHAGPDQIRRAAEKALAHSFVSRLADGYDTVLGERGTTISGGEAQRLILARMILKDPKILVLDEAMSALDGETARMVKSTLKRVFGDRSVLTISHRLDAIRDADRIICVDAGHVVGIGTHLELIDTCPVYRRLCEEQMKDLRPSLSVATK